MPVTQPNPTPLSTSGRVWQFAQEKAAWGTAGLAADCIQEPITSFDLAPQRETVDDMGQSGAMSDVHGIDEASHYEQFTVRLDTRPNGASAFFGAEMMGPITDTPTASAPYYLHGLTPHPTSGLMPTFTHFYRASIEGTTTKQLVAGTPTTLHWTFANNTEVQFEGTFWGKFATNAAILTPATRIGSTVWATGAGAATDVTRLMGNAGTFTLIGQSGSAYNTRVLSGDFTMTRALEVCHDCTSVDAYYIKAGALSFAGNLTVVFEGYGTGTVENDFRNFGPGGTATTPNKLRFTSKVDATYIEWVSQPWYITSWSLDHSGQYVKATIGFRAVNNPTGVYAATPTLSGIGMNVNNYVATPLIVP